MRITRPAGTIPLFEQLSVNTRSAPERIGKTDLVDQAPNFGRHFRPPYT
jgi:hypothetical protein